MSWKRGKEEEDQVVGVEEVAAAVVAPRHQARVRALDHHRGARGLGQGVEVEVAAEVEAVDAQCKPENHALSFPISTSCYFSLTIRFLHTEVANTTAEAQQHHTNPEADHQVEFYPLPLAAAFSVLHLYSRVYGFTEHTYTTTTIHTVSATGPETTSTRPYP